MRKIFILFCFVFFMLSLDLPAQVLKFSKDTAKFNVLPDRENILINHFQNTTNATINTRWTRTVIFKPDTWGMPAVCDKILCYAPSTSSKTVDIAAGETSYIKIQAMPGGVDSCALFKISLAPNGVTVAVDSSYYFFVSENCRQLVENKAYKLEMMHVAPNISKTFVVLENNVPLKNLKIYNSNGQLIDTYYQYNKGMIDIQNYAQGSYYIIGTAPDDTKYLARFMKI